MTEMADISGHIFALASKTLSWLGNASKLSLLSLFDNVAPWLGRVWFVFGSCFGLLTEMAGVAEKCDRNGRTLEREKDWHGYCYNK
jgi:hypothetical protein